MIHIEYSNVSNIILSVRKSRVAWHIILLLHVFNGFIIYGFAAIVFFNDTMNISNLVAIPGEFIVAPLEASKGCIGCIYATNFNTSFYKIFVCKIQIIGI